ncbi:MAG TPA: acyloxyacyl hydrolase [Vicinamibacterales bacterium]
MAPTISHRPLALLVIASSFAAVVALAVPRNALAQWAPGPVPADDPFARRGWHLELGGHGALEAWNYNISHEEMVALVAGLTYGLRDGLQLTASWPMYFVSQRGTDAYLVGATFGVRCRVYHRQRWAAFLELKVGVSGADTFVPPRGTRFNYLALGGAGATVRLRRSIHGLAGLEWIHVSNGGFAGRDRNPDIEAVGLKVGVLIGF